ncbi:MAG: LysM peptidoglycan-binding domain-containing protein [Aggregatilineales bacterium]
MKMIIRILCLVVGGCLLLTACNFNINEPTPTAEAIVEEPINPLPDQAEETPSPSPTLSPSPSATQGALVAIVSNTPPPTPGPPTETFTPAPTEGPWEYVVQSGDTLAFILRQAPYNYDIFSNPGIESAVIQLNSMSSANSLIAGQTLLIPRPTPTTIPQGIELTQEAIRALGGDPTYNLSGIIPPGTLFDCYRVEEGQTVIEIISRFPPLTLETICQLNLDNFSCLGCDFEQPGGGPTCGPQLSIGQCVNVPLPTLTPTLSPTPDGNETPTPTPTYRPPIQVYPPNGGLAPAAIIELQWVGVGRLARDEYYLVEVIDTTSGSAPEYLTTRNTSIRLPTTMIPTDGQTHNISWTVRVAVRNENGVFAPIGATSITRTFQWQSR